MGGSFFCRERITAIDSLLSPLRGNACGVSKRAFGLFSRVYQIRFDPPFRLRPIFSSKSIAPNREPAVFSERTPGVYTNLSCWRFVFYSITDNEIDSLLSPLRGTPTAYLNAPLACFLAYVKYASTLCFACAPFLAPKWIRSLGCATRARGAPA